MTTDVAARPAPGGAGSEASSAATTRVGLPVLLVVSATAYMALRAAGPITDPDTWWHLSLGREFRSGWSLSEPGRLSPFATEPWVATQWTLEVLASWLEDGFGLAGVAALTGVGVVLLALVLWRRARECSAPLPAGVATVVGLVGVSSVIAPRPVLASLILLAVTLGAWRRTIEDSRPRWWLIPISWLWAATHGFWFVGVMVGGVVIVGMLLDRSIDLRRAGRLSLVPVGAVVAAAVTPAGPALLLAPLQVNGVKEYIIEWQSPDFRSPGQLAVAAMIVIVAVTWSRRGRATWTDLLMMGTATFLLLYASRTVALAAVMLVPLTATVLQSWLGEGSTSRTRPSFRERSWLAVGMAGAGVIVLGSTLVRAPMNDPYPRAIDEALANMPAGSVVFNDYADGGWLSWRHPQLVHVIDGMTEAYSPRYIEQYRDAFLLAPGWFDFFIRADATAAFVPADSGIAAELQNHHHWRVRASEAGYVLLQAPGPEGRS